MPTPKVELRNVEMIYHTEDAETKAIQNLSFQVYENEFIGLVGPSGCGKSTVLSLISGLMFPSSGEVLVDGAAVRGPSRRIGYMLQQDYLYEWRTILDNALLGLEILGDKVPEKVDRVKELLSDFGLADFGTHYPDQLSGGMRQRVALTRTLAIDPDILLLDEPFSALDYQTRLFLEEEIGTVLRRQKKTVILVTHDIAEAIAMCDRVIVMSGRPGTVKDNHEITLTGEELTPLKAREAPEFREYFTRIWKELDVHV